MDALQSFVLESLRTMGVCLLVFFVFPELDSVRAAMLLGAVAVVPCFLSLLTTVYTAIVHRHAIGTAITDIIAFLCQVSAIRLKVT